MARSTQKTSAERPNLTAAAPASATKRNRNGLPWKRYFTRLGVAPFDEVQWETREASICLLYTSPSPRDLSTSRMPSSA